MKQLVKTFENEIICDFEVSSKTKKVWNVELNILEVVKDICEKNNIIFYAVCGTLLGAVRHKGFIPWDDDIDIGMPRKDYEFFFSIIDNELPEELYAQKYTNTKSFPYDMIKIRDSRTTGYTPWEKDEKCHKGIFIDVFPIDNISDDEQENEIEIKSIKRLIYLAQLFSRKMDSKGRLRILKTFIKYVLRKFGGRAKIYVINKAISICKSHNTEQTINCGLRHGSFSHVWRVNSCQDLVIVPFEQTSIYIPQKYDEILRTIYGDYEKYVRGDSMHEGTVFDPEVPYMKYMIERSGI